MGSSEHRTSNNNHMHISAAVYPLFAFGDLFNIVKQALT